MDESKETYCHLADHHYYPADPDPPAHPHHFPDPYYRLGHLMARSHPHSRSRGLDCYQWLACTHRLDSYHMLEWCSLLDSRRRPGSKTETRRDNLAPQTRQENGESAYWADSFRAA